MGQPPPPTSPRVFYVQHNIWTTYLTGLRFMAHTAPEIPQNVLKGRPRRTMKPPETYEKIPRNALKKPQHLYWRASAPSGCNLGCFVPVAGAVVVVTLWLWSFFCFGLFCLAQHDS